MLKTIKKAFLSNSPHSNNLNLIFYWELLTFFVFYSYPI